MSFVLHSLRTILGVWVIVVVCGCATSSSRAPSLTFEDLLVTREETYAALRLHNPIPRPLWVEGFGVDEPLERIERREGSDWVIATGAPFCANGAEAQLVAPGQTVWIRIRVEREYEPQVLRIGIRRLVDESDFRDDTDNLIWSDPFEVPALSLPSDTVGR